MIEQSRLRDFLDGLASDGATPGGGSAAAVMGAMAAALVSMVCRLTVGKQAYAEVEPQMQAVLESAEALRARITGMIEDDVRAFDEVMGAYRLPKDTDAQKEARREAIQNALRSATEVPLQCARSCAQLIELTRRAAELGNVNVISDAGVAVVAAHAAMRSAALNVYINAGNIKDEAFVREHLAELEALLEANARETEAIYELVKGRL